MIHWPFLRRPRPAIPAGRRVYAVGDVHGRLDLLDDLLARIAADGAARTALPTYLVLLGDLIDRGPDSAGVVLRAMRPDPAFAGVAVLRGNHEQAMLDALDGDVAALALWLGKGGDAALASWGADMAALDVAEPEERLAIVRAAVPASVHHWMLRRPLSGRIGDYFFAHAGVRPGVPLAGQAARDLIAIRAPFLASRRRHGAVIVHGHSRRANVVQRANRIGLDTGAWTTGVLTAMGLEESDRWFLQTAGAPG